MANTYTLAELQAMAERDKLAVHAIELGCDLDNERRRCAVLTGDLANRLARIAELEAELATHQESQFHPDWSLLQATRESLREAQARIAELEVDSKRLRIFSSDLHDIALNGHLDSELLAMRGVAALTAKDSATEAEVKEAYCWLEMTERESAGGASE